MSKNSELQDRYAEAVEGLRFAKAYTKQFVEPAEGTAIKETLLREAQIVIERWEQEITAIEVEMDGNSD
jgi:hypothetical protein